MGPVTSFAAKRAGAQYLGASPITPQLPHKAGFRRRRHLRDAVHATEFTSGACAGLVAARVTVVLGLVWWRVRPGARPLPMSAAVACAYQRRAYEEVWPIKASSAGTGAVRIGRAHGRRAADVDWYDGARYRGVARRARGTRLWQPACARCASAASARVRALPMAGLILWTARSPVLVGEFDRGSVVCIGLVAVEPATRLLRRGAGRSTYLRHRREGLSDTDTGRACHTGLWKGSQRCDLRNSTAVPRAANTSPPGDGPAKPVNGPVSVRSFTWNNSNPAPRKSTWAANGARSSPRAVSDVLFHSSWIRSTRPSRAAARHPQVRGARCLRRRSSFPEGFHRQ